MSQAEKNFACCLESANAVVKNFAQLKDFSPTMGLLHSSSYCPYQTTMIARLFRLAVSSAVKCEPFLRRITFLLQAQVRSRYSLPYEHLHFESSDHVHYNFSVDRRHKVAIKL
jgi:hypothetical protein